MEPTKLCSKDITCNPSCKNYKEKKREGKSKERKTAKGGKKMKGRKKDEQKNYEAILRKQK